MTDTLSVIAAPLSHAAERTLPMIELIEFTPAISTKEAAGSVFQFLGITDFKEHESLNYPPENGYFKGENDRYTVRIYAVDDSDIATHRLSVSAESPIEDVFLNKIIQRLTALRWEPRRNE